MTTRKRAPKAVKPVEAAVEPTVEPEPEPTTAIPNVQSEAEPASLAPEDIRNGAVAITEIEIPNGAHVEAYGSTVWECSEGDFVSKIGPESVAEHIATAHKKST